jgi:hypothetical protein
MLGRLRRVPIDEMFGAGGGDFTAWLRHNVDVVNEAIDLKLSGVQEDGPGSAADVVARDEWGNSVVIQKLTEEESDATLGKLVRGMVGADAATGVLVVPRSQPDHTSIVRWLNDKTPFDFYLLQVEAYRIDDSAPAPVLNLISGPEHAAPPAENSLRNLPEEAPEEAPEAVPEEAQAPVAPVPDDPEETYAAGDHPDTAQEPSNAYDPSGEEDLEAIPVAEEPVDEPLTAAAMPSDSLGPEAAEGAVSTVVETAPEEPATSYEAFESYSATAESPATEDVEVLPEEPIAREAFSEEALQEEGVSEENAFVDVADAEISAEQARDGASDELAQWFWGELLSKAEQRTRIHADVAPPSGRVVGASAGLAGLDYNYVIEDHAARVELYIDRGAGREGENETIFNALQATQDAIEYNFGGPLAWQREPASDGALRISIHVEDIGLKDEESRWSEVQDAMVDAMVRLERAMRPHVARLQI